MFFNASGPGSLTGKSGPDPEVQRIMAEISRAYPQLGAPQLPGSAPQSPLSIAGIGYAGSGPNFYPGQSQAGLPFQNFASLFERGGAGVQPDSVTGALSSGIQGPTYSGAQTGFGTASLLPTGGGPGPGGGGLGQLSVGGFGVGGGTGAFVPDSSGGSSGMGGAQPSGGLDLSSALSAVNGTVQLARAVTPRTPGDTSTPPTTADTFPNTPGSFNPFDATVNNVPSAPSPGPIGGPMSQATDQSTAGPTITAPPGAEMMPPTGQTANEAGWFNGVSPLNLVLGGVNTISGLNSAVGGFQQGDPLKFAGGVTGTLGGINQMVPSLATDLFGQTAGPLVGSGLGALGGGIGLIEGIRSGSPLQTILGGAQLYQGAVPLANAGISALGGPANFLPTLTDMASSALQTISPTLADTLGISASTGGIASIGSGAAGSLAGFVEPAVTSGVAATEGGVQALSGAVAAAAPALATVAAVAPVVVGAIMAALQATNPLTNYGINKASGVIGPEVTAQLESIANTFLQSGGNLNSLPPAVLEQLVGQAGGALMGAYDPTGMGTGTSSSQTDVSRYMASNPGQALANINATETGLLQSIGLLQQAGVSNADIGALLPSSDIPLIGGLNAGGSAGPLGGQSIFPTSFYGQYADALTGGTPSGVTPAGNMWGEVTPANFGFGNYGPNINSPWFQSQAAGGPVWQLLAKLGYYDPTQAGALQQAGVTLPGANMDYLAQNYVPQGWQSYYVPPAADQNMSIGGG